MQKQVRERKAALTDTDGQERSDVFSLLVRANEEDGKFTLDADELIGNVFGLLFAGHETTAHVLAATLGFLAIYPDMQQEVYEEIVNVVGLERDTSFDDFNNLEKVLSVFYEALRLYPPGYLMIRQATEDTILTIPNAQGEEGTCTIAIQEGAEVVVDMVGVHYNPRHFPEPNKYKPSRWYGNLQDLEAMTAFSIGPRACIGRKFAAIEAVCFLTLLLRDWRVEPAPSSMKPGETGEEWKERMMDAKVFLTLGPGSVPVRLVRREK
ncbi:cytochrome P450 [Stereum hirsutum FP-91666 SS1]|uniref:cytochrome P450 n=1 Tax=Stereum hirsutum (strain FP-91666) TaxID=721885 RepID=UPI000440C5D1|nr:cytochrome P450 [Stereum hirsutum FP-91666 SS1]EIM88975.1 cytochrome P450 [Stereum hirsutum FP-91666 SS1]